MSKILVLVRWQGHNLNWALCFSTDSCFKNKDVSFWTSLNSINNSILRVLHAIHTPLLNCPTDWWTDRQMNREQTWNFGQIRGRKLLKSWSNLPGIDVFTQRQNSIWKRKIDKFKDKKGTPFYPLHCCTCTEDLIIFKCS